MIDRDRVVRICLIVALCCGLPLVAHAAVPHLIRFQGQAVDSKNVPLEGPYTLTFRLYDAQTAGTKLWEETQANIPISGGYFSVLLGQVTALNVDWSKTLWLSVQVGTDPELTPRQQITSVPLSIRAEVAEALVDPALPSGAIILWTGSSCPSGYTRFSSADGKFLVSDGTYNPAAGGSNTRNLQHNHGGVTGGHTLTIAEMPSHTHTVVGRRIRKSGSDNEVAVLENTGDVDKGAYSEETNPTGGGGSHDHPIASDLSSSFDIRPAFATILLCQKN